MCVQGNPGRGRRYVSWEGYKVVAHTIIQFIEQKGDLNTQLQLY
jgi:CTP-dependent riboflavin kinase